MIAQEPPVKMRADALHRLLHHQIMRGIADPSESIAGASDMTMRMAEFWNAVAIVETFAGQSFSSRAEAHARMFQGAEGGGFGIREPLQKAVLSLLTPLDGKADAPAAPSPAAAKMSPEVSLDPATVAQVSERLGNYVYMLVDPRDSRPFYVGKGVNVRMMSHGLEAQDANGDMDSAKVARIKEIRAAGHEPEIWIVRYGMSRAEYTAVEAAVIDSLGSFPIVPSATAYRPLELRDELTNMRREDAKGKGMILLDRLVDELAAPPLTTNRPLLLITLGAWNDEELEVAGGRTRHGNGFKREWYEPQVRDESIQELEMSTTAWWKLSRGSVESRGIEHAVAVYRGVTRGLFWIDPDSWASAGSRKAFVGEPILSGGLYAQVVGPHGHRVRAKQRGTQNPIAYWPPG